jgi:hypothetical protein
MQWLQVVLLASRIALDPAHGNLGAKPNGEEIALRHAAQRRVLELGEGPPPLTNFR